MSRKSLTFVFDNDRRIDAGAFGVLLCVILLYLSYFSWFPLANYIDEAVALALFIPALFGVISKSKTKKDLRRIGCLLAVLLLIGISSNLFSGVERSLSDVLIDAFSFFKIFIVYLGVNTILFRNSKSSRELIIALGKIAKVFIILSFIFSILNLVGLVEMTERVRYGIKAFAFYFQNASQYGVFVGAAFAFLIYAKMDKWLYSFMAIFVLLMTTKGMALIIAAVYIVLEIISHRKKIKLWQIIIVGVALAFALQYQFNVYLLDSTHPRAILIKYGFITAMTYFPFGAGFGTYGTDVAISHYSPLYIQYGFRGRAALSDYEYGYAILNDVYLGMVAGEFGFIGLAIWVWLVALIGLRIIKTKVLSQKSFHIALACYVCLCGMFVMAGSVKGYTGEILMIVLAVFNNLNEQTIQVRKI